MNEDRYEGNRLSYVVSTVLLILGIMLLGFSIYLTPMYLFNIQYDVHDYYFELIARLGEQLNWSDAAIRRVLLAALVLAALICISISMLISKRIDQKLLGIKQTSRVSSWYERHVGLILAIKLAALVGLIVFIGTSIG